MQYISHYEISSLILRKIIAVQHILILYCEIKFPNCNCHFFSNHHINGSSKSNNEFFARGISATSHLKKLNCLLETRTFSSSIRSAG